jgi:hypothetical protein
MVEGVNRALDSTPSNASTRDRATIVQPLDALTLLWYYWRIVPIKGTAKDDVAS